MNDTIVVDVAIVGAGPAGSCCAYYLGKNSELSVALIDKSTFPRDKSCGDGLGPGAIGIASEMGMDDFLSQYKTIEYITVSAPSGKAVTGGAPRVEGSKPIGYVIPRTILDHAILKQALTVGPIDLTGNGFKDASFDEKTKLWTVTLTNTQTKQTRSVQCKYLIGADGARSRVRRLFGQPMNDDANTAIGVRIYGERTKTEKRDLRIDFTKELSPAYGWVFPEDETKCNIGLGVHLDYYHEKNVHINDLLDDYITYCETHSDIKVDRDSIKSYVLPAGSQMPEFGFEHGALLGDAASMINPLTGEGIFYGMWAGRALAQELDICDKKDQSFAKASKRYTKAFNKKFKEHFHTNWRMSQAVGRKGLMNSVMDAGSKDKDIVSVMLEIMMGDRKKVDAGTLMKLVLNGVKREG